jgi:PhnB protein
MKLYAQLNFGGNCEEAFRYYETHLGGKITMMLHASETPSAPKEWGKAIVHARMSIGETLLTGNDVPSDVFKPIRSVYLTLAVDSAAEAERIHNALADGGKISIPLGETFFATRFSQLRDRFDVNWSIMHEKPQQQK